MNTVQHEMDREHGLGERYFSVREVAATKSVHPDTVLRWIKNNNIPIRRIGGRIRISACDARKFGQTEE